MDDIKAFLAKEDGEALEQTKGGLMLRASKGEIVKEARVLYNIFFGMRAQILAASIAAPIHDGLEFMIAKGAFMPRRQRRAVKFVIASLLGAAIWPITEINEFAALGINEIFITKLPQQLFVLIGKPVCVADEIIPSFHISVLAYILPGSARKSGRDSAFKNPNRHQHRHGGACRKGRRGLRTSRGRVAGVHFHGAYPCRNPWPASPAGFPGG